VGGYAKQVTSGDPRGENLREWGQESWWPCYCSPAPNPSRGKKFIRPVSHLASKISRCGKSKTDVIMRVTFYPRMVPTHHLLETFSPPSKNTGLKEVLFCIAHYVIILGLFWWWASNVAWRLSCTQCMLLCQFVLPFKWKHAS